MIKELFEETEYKIDTQPFSCLVKKYEPMEIKPGVESKPFFMKFGDSFDATEVKKKIRMPRKKKKAWKNIMVKRNTFDYVEMTKYKDWLLLERARYMITYKKGRSVGMSKGKFIKGSDYYIINDLWTVERLHQFMKEMDEKNPAPYFYEDLKPQVVNDSVVPSQRLKFIDPITGEQKEGDITWKDKEDFNKGVDVNF